jgi:signal transduction histidine kinase
MAAGSDEGTMLDIKSPTPSPSASLAVRLVEPPEPARAPARAPLQRPRGLGLASRLLLLTIGFALLAQVMIYVPRIATVRENWLRDRLAAANTAALVFAAAPDDILPKELARKILDSVGAKTIALKTRDTHRLLAVAEMPPVVSDSYDLRDPSMAEGIGAAFRALFAPPGAVLQLIGPAPMDGAYLEITLDETPLTAQMWRFTRNFLTNVMTISAVVVLAIWASIWLWVLRPVRRLTSNIMAFGERPQDAARIISPSGSRGEIGHAEQALATMQTALSQELGQKKRLAELGLAVAKINHDLRNMLTAAQLISDRLATITDPLAMRLAPRLVATLDRAIAFCQETLTYGAAVEKAPLRRRVGLREVIRQAIEASDARQTELVAYDIDVPETFEIFADPEQVLRVIENINRNAMQALAQFGPSSGRPAAIRYAATRANGSALIEVCDTGPGFPAHLERRIFEPFHLSSREGGSGLGLAIAADLTDRNGGSILLAPRQLDDFYCGARFQITLPAPQDETFEGAKRDASRA